MKRGSGNAMSKEHELFVAQKYGGMRSPSSGSSVRDRGDVRTNSQLIECKMTGEYHKPKMSYTIKISDMEKIAMDALSESRIPAMAIRIYNPNSVLSNQEGFVDLIVRRLIDDVEIMRHAEI